MNLPPNGEAIRLDWHELKDIDAKLLDPTGRMQLHPASFYQTFKPDTLRGWANLRSRYTLPTTELVEWLREQIAGRTALEVCAGNGDLGHHLGIRMTDSYQQTTDLPTLAYFKQWGIAPTRPPADVERFDAETAVRRFKPKVVIASYATQKYDPRNPFDGGNLLGVRHEYLIDRCNTFILIGNDKIHGRYKCMARPHTERFFSWLVTRSKEQGFNRIWVWGQVPH